MAPERDEPGPRLRSPSACEVLPPSGYTERTRRGRSPGLTPKMDCYQPSGSTAPSILMRSVERWEGSTRTVSKWDGLRRDPELWFEDGDCLIHLYSLGQSRRGPSFCVPFRVLKQSNCGSMFSLCFAQTTETSGPATNVLKQPSSKPVAPVPVSKKVELFVPAPEDITREASFRWHLTTRNFFAFIFGKPLVGIHLGQAMVDLQERMRLFRSGRVDNHKDFLDYAETQRYRNFTDFPDYSLAMLYYAEQYKLRDTWIDAFAHCVGMSDRLGSSSEYSQQSSLTKRLIHRSSLEMGVELDRTSLAVRNFLADDLSPAYFGLTDGARHHLERFRTFLHRFYADKFGYWPPLKGTPFSKPLYRSLYFDFKNLYDYLVDTDSTADFASQKLAIGGICVLQNVNSFDKRHKFSPQPHPMPLLPCEVPSGRRTTDSQRSLRTLSLASKQGKEERHLSARTALIAATNGEQTFLKEAAIIQAYMQFERQSAISHRYEKVSVADARKVRWLLIYGTLQYLVSALRTPPEVRDTEGPDYFLGCLVTENTRWKAGTNATSTSSTSLNGDTTDKSQSGSDQAHSESTSQSTFHTPIEPDCQNNDYLHHTNIDLGSGRVSVEIPAPLKIPQSSRPSSIRSRGRLSLASFAPKRTSALLRPRAHCEILVHGYGNGLNQTEIEKFPEPPSRTLSLNSGMKKQFSQSTTELETSRLRSKTSQLTNMYRPKSSNEKIVLRSRSQEPTSRQPIYYKDWDRKLSKKTSGDGSNTPNMLSFTCLTTSDSPNSLSSQDSSLWTDGGSSASSRSSTHDGQSEATKSSAKESGLLGGLVPIASSKSTTKSESPIGRPSFQFNFNFNAEPGSPGFLSGESVEFTDFNSNIGVAIADPPAWFTEPLLASPQTTPSIEKQPELYSAFPTIRDTDRPAIKRAEPKAEIPVVEPVRPTARKRRSSFWRSSKEKGVEEVVENKRQSVIEGETKTKPKRWSFWKG